MVFALGLLSMGLVVLLFLPAVWGRALRLSRRQLERQMPLSMAEVVAERDRLRAECALAQRRVEQRAERIVRSRAADLAELGRRAVRIASLEAEITARRNEIAATEAAWREIQQALTQTQVELGAITKDHYDTGGLLDRTRAALESLNEDYRRLNEIADQRRATIAALQTSIEGEKAKIEDMERRIEADARAMRHKDQEQQLIANARDAALAEVAFLEARHAGLQTRLATRVGEAGEMEATRAAAERARDAALAEARARQTSISEKNETIRQLELRVGELEEKLARSTRAGRAAEREMLERIEALRAENAVLEGKLTARRESDAAPTEPGQPEPIDAELEIAPETEDETAILRRSILEIAAEVRRLSGEDTLKSLPRLAEIGVRPERGANRGGRAAAPATLTNPDAAAQGEPAASS